MSSLNRPQRLDWGDEREGNRNKPEGGLLLSLWAAEDVTVLVEVIYNLVLAILFAIQIFCDDFCLKRDMIWGGIITSGQVGPSQSRRVSQKSLMPAYITPTTLLASLEQYWMQDVEKEVETLTLSSDTDNYLLLMANTHKIRTNYFTCHRQTSIQEGAVP